MMGREAQILTEWILPLCLWRLYNFSNPQPLFDSGVSDLVLLGLSAFISNGKREHGLILNIHLRLLLFIILW